jgi:hypothetical protein
MIHAKGRPKIPIQNLGPKVMGTSVPNTWGSIYTFRKRKKRTHAAIAARKSKRIYSNLRFRWFFIQMVDLCFNNSKKGQIIASGDKKNPIYV